MRASLVVRFALGILPLAILASAPAFADPKPCEELKTEIAAKLDAKGVKNYSLQIVATDAVGTAKVIGTCDSGTKKITYAR